jgi:hypothetical protein
MDKAWIIYNPEDGQLISIKRSAGSENSIEIPGKDAVEFLSGTKRLSDYEVIDKKLCFKKTESDQVPIFWNLISRDGWHLQILTDGETIKIYTKTPLEYVMLYASIKNNPTWLINTWDLGNYEIQDNAITINFINSDKYSYYIRW